MKTLAGAIILGAVLWTGSANAADWRLLGSNSTGGVLYIDQLSVRRDGASVTAWFRTDHSKDRTEKARETKVMSKYHCDRRETATLAMVEYFRDGRVKSNSTEERYAPFSPVVPDTMGELEFDAVCAPGAAWDALLLSKPPLSNAQ